MHGIVAQFKPIRQNTLADEAIDRSHSIRNIYFAILYSSRFNFRFNPFLPMTAD